MINFRL